jgi:hypothetical protein
MFHTVCPVQGVEEGLTCARTILTSLMIVNVLFKITNIVYYHLHHPPVNNSTRSGNERVNDPAVFVGQFVICYKRINNFKILVLQQG